MGGVTRLDLYRVVVDDHNQDVFQKAKKLSEDNPGLEVIPRIEDFKIDGAFFREIKNCKREVAGFWRDAYIDEYWEGEPGDVFFRSVTEDIDYLIGIEVDRLMEEEGRGLPVSQIQAIAKKTVEQLTWTRAIVVRMGRGVRYRCNVCAREIVPHKLVENEKCVCGNEIKKKPWEV